MNKDEENTKHKEEMKESSIPSAPLHSYPHQKIFKKCKSATFHLDGAIYTIVRVKRKFSRVEARGSGWIGMTSLESWKKTVKFLKKNDSLYLFSHENHTECILQNHGNLA
ncbi:hypothetical protein HZH66_009538 [Vespula vulgaris]|uniref:Uncharacterized protein n=1 Tax=Vespula vulgaris TaxID=7454 RepID=A0A834JLZ9_VESVU|nr:hypothetical protein HZH66_009538 [Vespula vulgaris]